MGYGEMRMRGIACMPCWNMVDRLNANDAHVLWTGSQIMLETQCSRCLKVRMDGMHALPHHACLLMQVVHL